MGKIFGFDLVKSREVGNGFYNQAGKGRGPVYDGGSDPNQEGQGILSTPFSPFSTPPFLGSYTKDYFLKGQSGGAVETRHNRLAADENEAAAIAAAINESEAPYRSSSTGKRSPPRPPPPVRGPVLYGDNDLQRFMTLLGLNYNRQGKRTRVHQRLMGWRMHGSKAGQVRDTKLARLIRQGKAFSVLSWKAGHDDLKFPASPALLKKYYTVANELGYLKNPAPPVGQTGQRKKKTVKIKVAKKKKKGKKKKKTKKKKQNQQTGLESLMDDMGIAEGEVESSQLEPLTGSSSQSGSGAGRGWRILANLLQTV